MMENVSLLLFYFMYQHVRCSIRRRAINRRRRRMFLILHRIKQNLLFLQSIQTATLTLLVAAARVVHPRLEWEYWAWLPRPRLALFELILQDDRQSRYWNNRNHTVGRLRNVHPTGMWKVIINIGMIWKCRLISVIQCWIRFSRHYNRFRIIFPELRAF